MSQDVMDRETPSVSDAEEALLAMAVSNPDQFKTFFRQIRKTHPRESLRVAFRYLAEKGTDDCAQACLLPWLLMIDYLDALLDPEFVPVGTAQRAADQLAGKDPRFFIQFLQWTKRPNEVRDRLLRGLAITDGLSDASALFSWLKTLTVAPDERMRAQAVKVICRVRANPLLVERQLQSKEFRVRANAIEALWGLQTEEAKAMFEKALEDTHHRVIMNGLIGLFYQKNASAFPKILECAHHPFEMHRAAAIWAMGVVGDPSAIPVLTAVAETDPSAHVREKAGQLLTRLSAKASAAVPAA